MTARSFQRSALSAGLLASLGACSGAAFEAAAAQEDAGATVVNHVVSAPGPEAGAPDGPAATVQVACSPARTDDAPSFAREVCLPGGGFTMGSNGSNLGASFADHTPAHAVTLSPFALDAYEVTVGRYRACVSAGGCRAAHTQGATGCTYTDAAGDNEALPVTCLPWADASAFCEWDQHRRLPTEAEWEYAVRGATDRMYPWGEQFTCNRAIIGGYGTGECPEYAGLLPRAVGSMSSGQSPEGVFDLVGNAGEWVADWVGSYSAQAVKDPQGPAMGSTRIVRGGFWTSASVSGLGYARTSAQPTDIGPWGFRCARSAG